MGNLTQIKRIENTLSPAVALKQPDQISALRKNHRLELAQFFNLLIVETTQYLNVSEANRMTGIQVAEAAAMVVEDYWMLRPEEVLLAFRSGKRGHYGPHYNKMDVSTITHWLNTYIDQDRAEALERIRTEQKTDRDTEAAEVTALLGDRAEKPLYPEPGTPPFVLRQSQQKREQEQRKHELELEVQKHILNQHGKKKLF